VVDDEPTPVAAYLRGFAGALGAPEPRRVPIWLARLLAGSAVVDAMTTSMHTSNARARRDLGWAPRYPTFRDGLGAVLAEWGEDGSGAPRAAGAV
jgi:2-alkyl-3-oxoalkanoate reductase